jgi:hypothetical protein
MKLYRRTVAYLHALFLTPILDVKWSESPGTDKYVNRKRSEQYSLTGCDNVQSAESSPPSAFSFTVEKLAHKKQEACISGSSMVF